MAKKKNDEFDKETYLARIIGKKYLSYSFIIPGVLILLVASSDKNQVLMWIGIAAIVLGAVLGIWFTQKKFP